MKELVQVAQSVVKAVSKDLPFAISLTDDNGYIVGTTDQERIGTFHPALKKVIESKSYVSFNELDIIGFDNVLPGIAVPLNFNGKIIGVLGMIGPPDQVKPYADLTKRYVELMWRDTFYKQIEELEDKMKETYLQYILFNDEINESHLIQYAEVLKLSLHSKYFCILIDIGNFLLSEFDHHANSITVNNLKALIIREIEHLFKNKETSIISFINTEKIVILQSVSCVDDYFGIMSDFKNKSERLMHKLIKYDIHTISISAGKLTSSLRTISHSYQEANDLIQNNGNDLSQTQFILSYFDWDVLTNLLPYKVDQTFRDRIIFRLNKLMENNSYVELKSSFITYCETGMNISEASKSLFVHRNTLIYRLNKIEEILSIQTRNFQHCTLLYLILRNL